MISDNNLKKRIQNHLIQIYGDIHSSDEIYSIADNLINERGSKGAAEKLAYIIFNSMKKL